MNKILIVHGIGSSSMYSNFSQEVIKGTGATAVTFIFDGFDNFRRGSINRYKTSLRNHLMYNKYDVIYAHSLGALILMECLDVIGSSTKIILDAPIYNCNVKLNTTISILISKIFLGKGKVKQTKRSDFLITRSLCAICNSKINITQEALDFMYECNPKSVLNVLKEALTYTTTLDYSTILEVLKHNKVYCILPTNDRIAKSFFGLTKSDFTKVYSIESGHSTVLCNESGLISIVREITGN